MTREETDQPKSPFNGKASKAGDQHHHRHQNEKQGPASGFLNFEGKNTQTRKRELTSVQPNRFLKSLGKKMVLAGG